MLHLLEKIRIPTTLGLGVIILGTAVLVYLTLGQQTLTSKAAVESTPEDIRITNIRDTSATVSWITKAATTGFVAFNLPGQSSQVALDERDSSSPADHIVHFVNLKNLNPTTRYQIKITSGRLTTNPQTLTTAPSTLKQNRLKPLIGTVLNGDQAIPEGLVDLDIPGAGEQSALIKNFGAFLIPLSAVRKSDLSDIYTPPSQPTASLVAVDGSGQQAKAIILLDQGQVIGPLRIGQNLILTTAIPTPPIASASAQPTSCTNDLRAYDLNGDGKVNASDYAEVVKNLGPHPKNLKADLNGDKIVNQLDLNCMQAQISKTNP